MAKFFVAYFGGSAPNTPEEGKAHFQKYQAWLVHRKESLVSPANPLQNTHVLQPNRTITKGHTTMSGYSILEADNIEQAIDLVQDCPFLDIGGTLEISELVSMPIRKN